MLHSTGLCNERVWDAWLQELPSSVAVRFHLAAGVPCDADLPGNRVVGQRLLPVQYPANWGAPNLLTTTVQAFAEVAR